MLLSIVLPCYNEGATIEQVLQRLEQLAGALVPEEIQLQIVAVDDASSDDTHVRLLAWRASADLECVILRHTTNMGKGAAIRTARTAVRGDVVVIQDADLEYDPADIPKLIRPIRSARADAVVGSRFVGNGEHRVLYFWHRVANGMLTLVSNMLTDLNLTDMETGYKAFTRDTFLLMHLTNRRFGIEPEIIARLAQMGARVYEVSISYHGRTYEEGKKITWRDGVAALMHIFRARLSASSQPKLPHAKRVSPSRAAAHSPRAS